MDYYFSTTVNLSFEEAKAKIVEALKTEGFGIVSEINMQEKFKEKLGIDFKRYTILGACNPLYAHKALLMEEMIGTMLPCNVIMTESKNGYIKIAAINPQASMIAVNNPELQTISQEITGKIKKVIDNL